MHLASRRTTGMQRTGRQLRGVGGQHLRSARPSCPWGTVSRGGQVWPFGCDRIAQEHERHVRLSALRLRESCAQYLAPTAVRTHCASCCAATPSRARLTRTRASSTRRLALSRSRVAFVSTAIFATRASRKRYSASPSDARGAAPAATSPRTRSVSRCARITAS